MARKDLLKNLMAAPPAPADGRPALPRSDRGAIGAVSKSISELKNRAIIEVPGDMIDSAGLDDRLDDDPQGIEALMASIKEYGQQVPRGGMISFSDDGGCPPCAGWGCRSRPWSAA